MPPTTGLVEESTFTALFDQAMAEARETVSPVRMARAEPKALPKPKLPPGHWGPESFPDQESAIAFIEEEDAEMYAEAHKGRTYWYIYYFDES